MTRAALSLSLCAALAGCSGAGTQELVVRFPVLPADVTAALVARFPDRLSIDDTRWPDTAAAVDLDLALTLRTPPLDLEASPPPFAGGSVRVRAGRLGIAGPDSSLDSVELLVGPETAVAPDEIGVVPVGRAPVPHGRELADLVFTEDGRRDAGQALLGKLPEQTAAKLVWFAIGRAPLHLEPGGPLPQGDEASELVATLTLEYGP